MGKRAWVLLPLVAIIVTAAGCGGGDEKTSVRVALDWFPWSNHSGLYIAKEKGYFAEEGLDVTIYTPNDPSTVLVTVGAGQDEFGLSYQVEVLLAQEQGVPAVLSGAATLGTSPARELQKSVADAFQADVAAEVSGDPRERLQDTLVELKDLKARLDAVRQTRAA